MDVSLSGNIMTLTPDGALLDAAVIANTNTSLDGIQYRNPSLGTYYWGTASNYVAYDFFNGMFQWYFHTRTADYESFVEFPSGADVDGPWDLPELQGGPVSGTQTVTQAVEPTAATVVNRSNIVSVTPFLDISRNPSLDVLVDAALVLGAGSDIVNGVYLRGPDVFGNKTYYQDPSLPSTQGQVIQDVGGGRWVIWNDGSAQYYHIDDHPYPWEVDSWQIQLGSAPAPTVIQATQADVSSRWKVRVALREIGPNGSEIQRNIFIRMGDVGSQVRWTNTPAGAKRAALEIPN